MRTTTNRRISTPWGPAEAVHKIARGITFYMTAGHGGFLLSPSRNAKIPQELKEKTWLKCGLKGWYEEDCDANLVITTFPQYFEEKVRAGARRSLEAHAKAESLSNHK